MCEQILISKKIVAYNEASADEQTLLQEFQSLRYLHKDVRQQWAQIVGQFANSQIGRINSFEELYYQLEKLRIKGVGNDTLIKTASELWFRYKETSPDDSCWNLFCNGPLAMNNVVKTVMQNDDFIKMSRLHQINFLLLQKNMLKILCKDM